MKFRGKIFPGIAVGLIGLLGLATSGRAGLLSVTYTDVLEGSVIDLTSEGKVDWVHWGLHTESSLNRKSGVAAQISDFRLLDAATGFAFAYQYADNFNGYSWDDGYPEISATNTPTGVWAYGTPLKGSGFEVSAPAYVSTRILKVYVGAFAAQAHFEAHLTDNSAPAYTNQDFMNIRNGPGRVYTIEYSADSAGQSVVVRWTLESPRDPAGNVTLQAATLSFAEANNPPVVALTSPTNNAKFAKDSSVALKATAHDADGTISLVEFWNETEKIGEASASPFEAQWNSVQPGRHVLWARAIDTLGATRNSIPIEIFVHDTGGTLSGSIGTPPPSVDLTAEGTSDWVHWGLRPPPELDRKANVTPLINQFAIIGGPAVQYSNEHTPYYSWSDGAPTLSEFATATGIYVAGFTNGFEFTVPADTTMRQLKVYGGMYGVKANFQAYLGDASAPAFTDTSLDFIYDSADALFTLDYAAASPNQRLHVRYRTLGVYDMDYGNVGLESVALRGPPGPKLLQLLNPVWVNGECKFSFVTDAGKTYEVEYAETLVPQSWQMLTNVLGTGTPAEITDANTTSSQRFYRARSLQ